MPITPKPVRVNDQYVATSNGKLFTRMWEPDSWEAFATDPLILFHESTGSVGQWRDFPEILATALGRKVLAYDRLGFGLSDAHPGRLTPTFMGDEARYFLSPLLEYFQVETFVAVGHSVGGEIAVSTAAAMPERVSAVVTISAQSFVEDVTLAGVNEAKMAFADPDKFRRVVRHHGDKARWVLDAWFDTWLDPAFADWTLDEALKRLACPLMAIHGKKDEFGSVAHPRRMTQVPSAPTRLELLEGVGHIPYRENPELITALIQDFLRSVGD